MMKYLPKLEIRVYFLCHILFILYSIYTVFTYRAEIFKSRQEDTFSRGWWGLQREVADTEWEHFKVFAVKSIPWLISHFSLSKLLILADLKQFLPWGYSFIGVAYLITSNGLIPTIFLFLNVIPFYFVIRTGRMNGILLLTINLLLVSNLAKVDEVYYWIVDNVEISESSLYQMVVLFGWSTLKCVSFAVDALEEKREAKNLKEFSFSYFLGYIFYFPTLVLGPPIIYSRFRTCYLEQRPEQSIAAKTFLKDITKVFFWFLILELSNHFLYFVNIRYSPQILDQFNIISLFGYGCLIGQHFHVKYVVLYGFSCAFAKLDGMEMPPRPICIARVHKYSDMWKHFDSGLHEFLVKYIYSRLQTRDRSGLFRRLLAMSATFAFIYVWHGYYFVLLFWSALNFAGILLEHLLNSLQRSEVYQKWIVDTFSLNNVLRIEAFLGMHLLIFAAITNFAFLANYEVAVLFLRRTYCCGLINYLSLSTSLVFIFFTSEYCKRREAVIIKESISHQD